jgi:hypothetical protein
VAALPWLLVVVLVPWVVRLVLAAVAPINQPTQPLVV